MTASRKGQLEWIGVAVLLVVFAGTLSHALKRPPARRSLEPVRASALPQVPPRLASTSPTSEAIEQEGVDRPAAAEANPADSKPAEALLPAVRYTADALRDPLVSLLPSVASQRMIVIPPEDHEPMPQLEPPPPAFNIEGLVWGGPRPQAVIDGAVYDVGDTVQGAKIMAIDRAGVTGTMQGRTIRWRPEVPRKTETYGTP
ncbi:MAG: hypothetical protein A3I71_06150 [Omnitrophica WOR_2 bacterium RIFCSPLOWO2_02_FULL_63_16]|nr:MAG: hypothetical protein A2Z92_01895 [Omnitrophica WOR_2 bacterium GWA2_63_20]OGX17369.1 MAG: hypothetical protein A2105_04740 [Omnitrophica WOR_2 bacterium GWF2_63_9]OGX36571.1 MAG: hypothetical protein A3B73_05265 [Omnitrophica WOR_2 bacterium RIFCSPHIGHO2_02_FULL_63_39]OGX46000.1 MAG: hypothetical protein A3I71_06150 [Omnitrophica WOR_2 bacterium RIFCSPLOWO2_02_FULL_63_16]OGX47317.1 MAG: hypothetical protein A3G88_03660 [Omnitrophica WOR_2 bacterium RIFCSPLOWO2_12_FULL_63_16]